MLVHCEIPLGKGVSSSAALEVASMQAICALLQAPIQGQELAMLCQQVENYVVGAPCGIMDQTTSACGVQDSLLALLCQPAELQEPVELPSALEVWGIDSGVRHAVTGSDYNAVRVGAFMGYRIIAELAELAARPLSEGRVSIDDPRWGGYLANVGPSLWAMHYRDHVPLELSGADFLARYGGSTDAVTHIDPRRLYAVRQPAAHPIYEHHRVRLFRALLSQGASSGEQLQLLGELMYQSHASYSACGLGSHGTDRLVEMIRHAGPAAGLYGAKITGGGSGGTVAVLARRGSRIHIERIVDAYQSATGLHSSLMTGSSPGALQWGIVRLV
jgi:L-arabinokinase